MRFKDKFFYIFLAFWFLLNLFTAAFTELYSDEAYYWMYSNFLDWGYFDHPPGIALLIKITSIFGKNELAVRLGTVILICASFYLMYRQIKPKNPYLFSAVLFISPVLHLIGFMALPDGFFFFAGIVFLLVFRQFIETKGIKNVILLGVISAVMIYSKYHAFIVILFSIIAVPKILLNYRIYLAGFVALILISPHIYWQIDNDFPTFSYHLVNRAASHYKIAHTTEFLTSNIFFLFGLAAVFLLFYLFKNKNRTDWHRILKYNFFGTYIFFFFISFKGQHIEANWTIPALFPLLYLGYRQVEQSKLAKVFKITTYLFIPIMILIRIHLLYPMFDFKKDRVWDFHRGNDYVQSVVQQSEDHIIAANSYQDASLLNFYANQNYWIPALNINSRANQYSLWKFEKEFCNKPRNLAYLANHIHSDTKIINRKKDSINLSFHNNFLFPNCIDFIVDTFYIKNKKANLSINIKNNIDSIYYKDFALNTYFISKESEINKTFEFTDALIKEKKLTWIFTLKEQNYTNIQILLNSNKLKGSNKQLKTMNLKK